MLNLLKKLDTNTEILLKMLTQTLNSALSRVDYTQLYLLYERMGKRKSVAAHYKFPSVWCSVLSSEIHV